jgi:hypothetical protein
MNTNTTTNKTRPRPGTRAHLAIISGVFALAFSVLPMTAATLLYWDADGDTTDAIGGTGTWALTSTIWRVGSTTGELTAWQDDSIAVFETASNVNANWNAKGRFAGMIFKTGTSGLNNAYEPVEFSPGATIQVDAGATANISVKFYGSNGYTKTGSGALNLFTGSMENFTGTVTHNGGTLQIRSADSIGTSGRLIIQDGTSVQFYGNADTTFGSVIPDAVTIADNGANLAFRVGRLANGEGVTHTFGALSLGTRTVNLVANATTSGVSRAIFSDTTLTGNATLDIAGATIALSLGALSETGDTEARTLTKTGTGALTLRGATNTATGNLVLKDGATTIDVDGGDTATFDGGLELGSAGKTTTLVLDTANVIFAEKLVVVADATIDFAATAGANTLVFGDSSDAVWTTSGTLRIKNFDPATDILRIGVASTGLTAGQLDKIIWVGLGEDGGDLTGGVINERGYIAATEALFPGLAIPEPATWAFLTAAVCAGFAVFFRRKTA